jgi:hypothetical protein
MHYLFDESGRHFLPLFSQIFRSPPACAGGFAYSLPFAKTRSPFVSTTWEMGYNVAELSNLQASAHFALNAS